MLRVACFFSLRCLFHEQVLFCRKTLLVEKPFGLPHSELIWSYIKGLVNLFQFSFRSL